MKFIKMGYCPNCCNEFNPRKVKEVPILEDEKGNRHCDKCKMKIGIKIKGKFTLGGDSEQ